MCCERRTDKFFTGMAFGMTAGVVLCCVVEKCCKCKHGHKKNKMIKKVEDCAEKLGDDLGL